MSDFCIDDGDFQLSTHNWGERSIGVSIAGAKSGHTVRLTRTQARALASALLQWAGSDDPVWGLLIPWYGGECPLDEWERQNHSVVLALAGGAKKLITSEATSGQWEWRQGFSRVVYYCVRKRPPAPVEEWVRLERCLPSGDTVAVEILMRDGKAVDARMAQEGE